MNFPIPVFNDLKKNLKKGINGQKGIRVALLGDSATQLLTIAIKGMAVEYNLNIDIWESDYDQIERQIFDTGSELYQFDPEYVIIFKSIKKTQQSFYDTSIESKPGYYHQWLEKAEAEYNQIKSRLSCKIIHFNFPEINDGVFGNYSNKTSFSFLYGIRKINTGLMELGQRLPDFFVCDIAALYTMVGVEFAHNAAIYVNTNVLFSIGFLPHVAKNIVDIITALRGRLSKCIILDLDNTCWGGIIGDDGMENIQIGDLGIGKAYTEFQNWVKQLQQRGIIIAICSKNDEDIAKEPFINHPDMKLRLSDIAVFVANWNPKPGNIRHIQSLLNIGFDSMVFIDDNPFERNFVREDIPDIIVPELPSNPEDYVSYLQGLNLFETATFSLDDTIRTNQYKVEAERVSYAQKFINEDDFLRSLEMTSQVNSFNKFTIPRVAQLTQRSNQFNLRTIRYSEGEIEQISKTSEFYTFTFTLKDKFGDNGLISVLILKKDSSTTLWIDTWIMSCRVLKRSVENFVLNELVEVAKENGFTHIRGEYLPTKKNGMVKDHYLHLGFTPDKNGWLLDIKQFTAKTSFIQKSN